MMSRGFTLLEVMVALVVFSLSSLAVMQVTGVTLRGQKLLEEKMVAGWVADNQIALLFLVSPTERELNRQGELEMAGRIWYWRSKVCPTEGGLLQYGEIDISTRGDFSDILLSRRTWFIADNAKDHL